MTEKKMFSDLGQNPWALRFQRYRLFLRLLFLQLFSSRRFMVVLRGAGMGDLIATLPACRHLVEKYPGRELVYVTQKPFVPLFAMAGFPIRAVADRLCALPQMARHFFPVYRPLNRDDAWLEPKVCFDEEFAACLGVTLSPEDRPRLFPPAELRESIRRQAREMSQGRPLIAVHPGPTDKVREWPLERWHLLAEILREKLDAVVIQIGVDHHTRWGTVEPIRVKGAIDLVGRLSLAKTACWLAACDGFVGIDSGPLHLAVAMETPAVGIMGPTSPEFRFHPSARTIIRRAEGLACLGCHHRVPRGHWNDGCPIDIACMKQVEPMDVYLAVATLLQNRQRQAGFAA